MKRKASCPILIALVLIGASSSCYFDRVWHAISYDGGATERFGFSITVYESAEKERVTEVTRNYHSAVEAQKDFEHELNRAGTVIERTNVRFVKTYAAEAVREEHTVIYLLKSGQLQIIEASSLKLALGFERARLKLNS